MDVSQFGSAESDRSVPPVVMVLGNADRAEMCPIVSWLKEQLSRPNPVNRLLASGGCQPPDSSSRFLPSATHDRHSTPDIIFAPEITFALNASQNNVYPDLIIVLQSWSNEYSCAEVNHLLAYAPLARIVVCYGAWCESDGRNQNIWPQSVRVPVWAAQSRIEREWGLIRNPGESLPLPWSASREEIFDTDHPPILESSNPQSFVIDTPDPAYRKSAIEIMMAAGHELVSEGPAIVLFDADPWGRSRTTALQTLKARHPSAIVVALLNLAQPSTVAELRDLGVTKVLHKLGFRPSSVDES